MASDSAVAAIQLPVLVWIRIISQLRRRSGGRRESGAFLLGKQGVALPRVTAYICYDDLDPNAYEWGGIAFHAVGYAALWEYCGKKKLEVLADVHTHPGEYIQQSDIDQHNPMVPIPGHVAMIVPNFGRTPWTSLKTVGVYEYLGDFKWRACRDSKKAPGINLKPW